MSRFMRGKMISEGKAKSLLNDLASYGNTYDRAFGAKLDVKTYCQQYGINYDEVLLQARTYGAQISHFENLIGSTWQTRGAKASRVFQNGHVEELVDGDGQFADADYWAYFEMSLKAFDRAISEGSMHELNGALERGVASIEAYLMHRAYLWNVTYPDRPLVDGQDYKVSFDKKVDVWVPIMTGGKRIPKGDRNWSDFVKIKKIRDDFVHAKKSASGMSDEKFKEISNIYRTGIAGVLLDMHKVFYEKVPCKIIKEYHSPQIFRNNSQ